MARRLGYVKETNSGAAAGVLPGNLSRQADRLLLPGKSEFEINLACGRQAVSDVDRCSAIADVGQNGAQVRGSGISDIGRRADGSAGSAAAFAAHEAAGGAQADASPFRSERAIENKIGAEPEYGASIEFAIDDGNQRASAVLGGLTQLHQEFIRTLVGAIVEDDGVEVPTFEQL